MAPWQRRRSAVRLLWIVVEGVIVLNMGATREYQRRVVAAGVATATGAFGINDAGAIAGQYTNSSMAPPGFVIASRNLITIIAARGS